MANAGSTASASNRNSLALVLDLDDPPDVLQQAALQVHQRLNSGEQATSPKQEVVVSPSARQLRREQGDGQDMDFPITLNPRAEMEMEEIHPDRILFDAGTTPDRGGFPFPPILEGVATSTEDEEVPPANRTGGPSSLLAVEHKHNEGTSSKEGMIPSLLEVHQHLNRGEQATSPKEVVVSPSARQLRREQRRDGRDMEMVDHAHADDRGGRGFPPILEGVAVTSSTEDEEVPLAHSTGGPPSSLLAEHKNIEGTSSKEGMIPSLLDVHHPHRQYHVVVQHSTSSDAPPIPMQLTRHESTTSLTPSFGGGVFEDTPKARKNGTPSSAGSTPSAQHAVKRDEDRSAFEPMVGPFPTSSDALPANERASEHSPSPNRSRPARTRPGAALLLDDSSYSFGPIVTEPSSAGVTPREQTSSSVRAERPVLPLAVCGSRTTWCGPSRQGRAEDETAGVATVQSFPKNTGRAQTTSMTVLAYGLLDRRVGWISVVTSSLRPHDKSCQDEFPVPLINTEAADEDQHRACSNPGGTEWRESTGTEDEDGADDRRGKAGGRWSEDRKPTATSSETFELLSAGQASPTFGTLEPQGGVPNSPEDSLGLPWQLERHERKTHRLPSYDITPKMQPRKNSMSSMTDSVSPGDQSFRSAATWLGRESAMAFSVGSSPNLGRGRL